MGKALHTALKVRKTSGGNKNEDTKKRIKEASGIETVNEQYQKRQPLQVKGNPYWNTGSTDMSFRHVTCRQERVDRLAPGMVKAGLLTVFDHQLFKMYCSCYAEYCMAEELLVKDPTCKIVMQTRERTRKMLLSLARDFGLTPASRLKLNVQTETEPDEFDKYLNENR